MADSDAWAEFDCVYGANGDWAMGTWKVLSDRGLEDKVKIAGLDLIPAAIDHPDSDTIAEVLPSA